MMPKDWKVVSLGEICSNKLQTGPFGSQLHSHEYVENGIPVLMPKDLIDYKADLQSAAKITEERAKDLSKHILKNGDLLFSRRGDVARFALIDEKSEGSICGTGCLKARPNENHSPKFLAYFLQKDGVKKWLEQNAVGQTMLNMNTEILKELPLVSASSRREEDKIAEILSTWDKAIETVEKLVANSQQQKKALMQQLLTGQKRLLDDNGVKFEDEWEEYPLSQISNIIMGTSPKSESYNDFENGLPLIQGNADIKNRRSNPRIWTSEITKECQPKDILMSVRAPVGTIAISNHHACIGRGIASIKAKKEHSQDFIYHWLLWFEPKWVSFSQGSTFESINSDDIKSLKISVPTIKEQEKIAQVLTLADREIDLYKEQLDKLKLEKKSLMQQLLTGQKRVKF